MKASEVVRAARDLVQKGWVTGWHTADADGNPLPPGSDARVPNPAAARFSIFGAVSRVLLTERLDSPPRELWEALTDQAVKQRTDRDNIHIHPVVSINDRPGQTIEGVLEYLDNVIERLEAAEGKAQEGNP